MTSSRLRAALSPWAGLFLGAAAWFVHQTVGADADDLARRMGGPLWTFLLTLVCGAVTGVGGWISWTSGRRGERADPSPQSRRFAGRVGATSAAVFLLAILLQTLADLIVPPGRP